MSKQTWFERDLVGDTSGHEIATRLMVVSSAKGAVLSRPGWVAALGAMGLAGVSGVSALLLLVPVVFTLLFARRLFDRRGRQDADRRARQMPILLPEVSSFNDGRVKALISRLTAARQAINAVVNAAPTGGAFDLSGSIAGVPRLERQVVVLASRIEYLAHFIQLTPLSDAQADFSRLTSWAARRGEPGTEDFQRAAERCQSRVSTTVEVSAEIRRLLGRAELALCQLEELPAKLLMVQLRRLEACDDEGSGDETVSGPLGDAEVWDDVTTESARVNLRTMNGQA